MSDLELWKRLKEGDKSALEQIYRTHAAQLLKYGRKFTRNEQLVEDCVQDLFIEIWRNRTGLSETDAIQPYLLLSLRRKIVRQVEKSKKMVADTEYTEADFDAEISIDHILIEQELSTERAQQLKAAMDNLSKRQKEVIYLKYITGLDYEDISEVMNLNYQSARNLVSSALRALKKQMLFIFWGFAF